MDQALQGVITATVIAFALNIILCFMLIPILKRIKFGQNVRDDGPKSHLKKSGTPTMGGVIILIAFTVSSLFFLYNNPLGLLLVFLTLSFGLIGFLDDYIKIVKKRSLGLRPIQKIILQLAAAIIFILLLTVTQEGEFNKFLIPFMQDRYINTGFLFIPIAIFIILGTVNAVNLTDGLDGLATGVTVLVATFFLFISLTIGSDVLPITGAAVGSLLGFLLFNTYPAKVFMGDTGSLALGGFVVGVAIILRMPLFLVLVGIVYVAETLSVILQVWYFKKTKGKRLFLMAPLHHHFEESGMSESRVVAMFYFVTVIACLVGFLATR